MTLLITHLNLDINKFQKSIINHFNLNLNSYLLTSFENLLKLEKIKLSYFTCNVQKRQKLIITDTIYSNVFVIDNKCKMVKLFVKQNFKL